MPCFFTPHCILLPSLPRAHPSLATFLHVSFERGSPSPASVDTCPLLITSPECFPQTITAVTTVAARSWSYLFLRGTPNSANLRQVTLATLKHCFSTLKCPCLLCCDCPEIDSALSGAGAFRSRVTWQQPTRKEPPRALVPEQSKRQGSGKKGRQESAAVKGKVQRKPGSPRIRSRRHLFIDRHASPPSSTSSAANFTQTCTFDNFVFVRPPSSRRTEHGDQLISALPPWHPHQPFSEPTRHL